MNVELAVAEAEHADRTEDEDRRVEQVIRHHAEPNPQPDHGQVQHQEHEVPDPHRDDDAPEERRLVGHDRRPGLDPWMIIAPIMRAMTGFVGMPRVSMGMKEVLGTGVVGRLGRGHALDGAFPELGGMFRNLLLERIGGEGGKQGPPARQDPEGRPEQPSPGGWVRPSVSSPLGSGMRLVIFLTTRPAVLSRSRFRTISPSAEHAHGDSDEADAVHQLLEPECIPSCPGVHIRANEAEEQPQHDHADGLEQGTTGEDHGGDEA